MVRPRLVKHLPAAARPATGGRRHGFASTYAHGCRCEPCKQAYRERCADFRARAAAERFVDEHGRLHAPVPEHMHGKLSTYANRGCRCLRCTKARSDYGRRTYKPRHNKLKPDELARLRRAVGVSEKGACAA